MITPNLMKQIGDAMKAHDAVRVSTLRGLSAELKNAKINIYNPNATEQRELTEAEEIAVVRKEAKKRKEAIEMYAKAGAEDRATNEKQELAILQEFLPAEVTEEQIIQLVNESITQLNAKTIADMGKVIADVKSKNSGVDGGNGCTACTGETKLKMVKINISKQANYPISGVKVRKFLQEFFKKHGIVSDAECHVSFVGEAKMLEIGKKIL